MSTETSHDRWVNDGNCPAISPFKVWCNHPAGHDGPHTAPRLQPPTPSGPTASDLPKIGVTEWEDL